MDIHYLAQTVADVPETDAWLSPRELARLHTLRFPKRRSDWRLGRWTAKRAVAALQGFALEQLTHIEIRPAPSGAPDLYIENQLSPMTLSISHRSGIAICAVAESAVKLGCDVELIEARGSAFLEDYFTPEEQLLFARYQDASPLATLLWSAKESALKARRIGLRVDTRSIRVEIGESSIAGKWAPLLVHCETSANFYGWWREDSGTVCTIVADPPPSAPYQLDVRALRETSCA
jgi:4'-phosphopantetheinyl transferase